MNESSEKDFLVYQGNSKPRVIRFVWTLFFLFGAYYVGKFAIPNLLEWLK